jgi:hypothetical protein
MQSFQSPIPSGGLSAETQDRKFAVPIDGRSFSELPEAAAMRFTSFTS